MNNVHVIVKQITKFDGRRADEVLEWDSKLWASLIVYNKTIFNVLQGQERPSELDIDKETTHAIWDAANQDLYNALYFTTGGSAFSVVRRFQGKTPAEGEGHGQRLGSPSREIRRVFAGGHLGGAHQYKHADAPLPRPRRLFVPHGQLPGPSQRVPSTEDPKDRQYEDFILQAFPSEYGRIRETHLERRNVGLADIRHMMTAIYADNLSRSE